MISLLLGMSPLVALAQNPADRAVVATIAEIHANPRAFNGKRVRLQGRIYDCKPLSCHMVVSGTPKSLGPQYLAIESNDEFDLQVTSEAPVDIIIHATVDATCLSGNVICLDRANALTRIALERIIPVKKTQTPAKEQ